MDGRRLFGPDTGTYTIPGEGLQGRFVGFAGADANGVLYGGDKDLAVTNLAGAGGGHDSGDDPVDVSGGNGGFNLDLWQEVYGVFGATVDLGVTLLAAVTFDFGDGHALNAKVGQGLPDLLQLEGFDDGCD